MKSIIEKYDLLCNKYQEIEEDTGEKEIHDKRVTLRRVFSILDLYSISPSAVKYGKEAFKLYGKLRDIQVQILKLEDEYEKIELYDYLEFLKKLETKYKEKINKFSSKRRVIFPVVKEKKIEIAEIKVEVEKRLQTVVVKTELLRKKNAKSIHRVRIEFKKFRYMLEILAFIEKAYEAKVETLKRYQDLLGDIQDSEVLLKGITKFYGKGKADKIKNIDMIARNKSLKIEQFIEEKPKFIEVCHEASKNQGLIP